METISSTQKQETQQINKQTSPKLAPPGAGIPFHHNLFLRFYVGPFVAAKTDWSKSEQTFYKVNARILKEIENLTTKELETRVLVPRQTGLEDSSRFWSIAMTLEHLTIVNEAMSAGIVMLSSGEIPPGQVDIAAVKPSGQLSTEESLNAYKLSISDEYKKFLKLIQNKNSKLTLRHPWFGDFTAQQWFWLMGMHAAIHLKQIREIKKGLSIL